MGMWGFTQSMEFSLIIFTEFLSRKIEAHP